MSLPLQTTLLWGTLNYHHYEAFRAIDPSGKALDWTGKPTRRSDIGQVGGGRWPNQCSRTTATPNYMIAGNVQFVRNLAPGQYEICRQYITRNDCADQAIAANGMLYYLSGACNCNHAWLRGVLATSSEPVLAPIEESRRLSTGPAYDGAHPDDQFPSTTAQSSSHSYWELPAKTFGRFGPPEETMEGAPDPIATGDPLRDDWNNNDVLFVKQTVPVSSGGLTFVSDVHEHRVKALDGAGSTIWSFEAGGRVSSAPVVHRGLVLFGSHDGYVYAVRAADGALVWRYLAAAYQHRIVAYGQVESAWPVYGVVVHDGALYYSAGRHPELNGGMWVGRLDPFPGQSRWRTVVRRTATWQDAQSPNQERSTGSYSIANTVPAIAEGMLKVGSGQFDLATGAFTHANTEYVNTVFTGTIAEPSVGALPPAASVFTSAARLRLSATSFHLNRAGHARVVLYDPAGRTVQVLHDGPARAGRTALPLLSRITPGYYVLRLHVAGESISRKILRM